MKCFYHSDSDGRCAAYWVARSTAKANQLQLSDFIAMDYNKAFPFGVVEDDEEVYIVDYSIEPIEMSTLLKITPNIIFIDHHKTAIEKYEDYPEPIRGVRYDGVAACMLTYCYLNHMTDKGRGPIKPLDPTMVEAAPMFTKLLADWDVWKFDYGDDTRFFQLAFNAYNFSPLNENWDMFTEGNNAVSALIAEGQAMLKYRDGWAKAYCKSRGFATDFEGHKCFALNLGLCNGEYFKSVYDDDYDIFIPFTYDGANWIYSLYSHSIDVSEIAKKYGGGGHRAASGFSHEKLLLKAI